MQTPERFQFVTTEDASPSLRFVLGTEEHSESMHSLRGAFSETVYIYGTAISKVVSEGWPPHVLSLGLGLGYNEILVATLFTAAALEERAEIESFEIDDDLRAYFAAWIRGERDRVPSEFYSAYDEILTRACAHSGVEPTQARATLKRWLESDQLRLREALVGGVTRFERRFSCFLFDAFSSKTTPDLWQESFLVDFLATTAHDRAVFSTYACTGALKRALRASGFSLEIRPGFSSKRDSTFAIRQTKSPIS